MTEQEALDLIKQHSQYRPAFRNALKLAWQAREEQSGEATKLTKMFGACDLNLVRFYKLGDFEAAYRSALDVVNAS